MIKLFNKIDSLQEEINAFRPIEETLQQTLQEKLRIEWTYNSNAIEGNTLTLGETAFYLMEGLTSEGRPLKDYLEARNHAEAIDGLHDIIEKKRDLTEGLIKEFHAVLLRGAEFTGALGNDGRRVKKPVSPGQYKIRSNHVLTLSGKIHTYVDPLHVRDEMEKLFHWYHHKSQALHTVERSAIFHYRFVRIHPFDDGNGRMARILMNLILMKEGFPPCIIQTRHRKRYLESLEAVDTKGDTAPFVTFVGGELLVTQKTILEVLQGRETAFLQSKEKLGREDREIRILKIIRPGPVSIGRIHEVLSQIKRPTLKSDLQRLVRLKKIQKKGSGKGVVYFISKMGGND